MPNAEPLELADLLERAHILATSGRRTILGIVGAPGSGKSTLAHALVEQLEGLAVLVPMDGFHLANEVLIGLNRRERKGAPDTFDADGYVALLRRLRAQAESIVYAPHFDRDLEESIGSAIPVAQHIPLVITEGNYLLLDQEPWDLIRPLLDEAWYLNPDERIRQQRLIDRHMAFGKDEQSAREWALGTDERNAQIIQASAYRADLIIELRD